jgi:UPF0755 protein
VNRGPSRPKHALPDDQRPVFGQRQGELQNARRPPRLPHPDERPTEIIPPVDQRGFLDEQDLYPEDMEPYAEDQYHDDEFFEDEYYDEFYEDEFEEEYDDFFDEEEDERAAPEYFADERPPRRRGGGKPRKKRRRRRAFGWVAALAVIGLIAGGAWYGIDAIFGYEDFDGDGDGDVLVQVSDGDSTNAIAAKLTNAGVVASPKAFVKAAEDNTKVRSVQPGYYQLKSKMSGTSAVSRLIEPAARVGLMQLRAGTQLDDIKQPDGNATDGVFTQLMKASCTTLNGRSTCVSVDDLRKAADTADLGSLGVPSWAVADATKADKGHRVEGLVAPGLYDVMPGWNANQLLGSVLRTSATRLQAAGMPVTGAGGQTPYQVLVIASLIEREGVQQDFDKVSRVIYNRLGRNMRLGLDSTVNYLLDKPVVTTRDEDRNRPGPYNTYLNNGLPPTPISSPSQDAIAAAEKPADGQWLFFVKCEKNGLSCFAVTDQEHQQNIRDARARGAF